MKSMFALTVLLASFGTMNSSYALDLSGTYEAQFAVANGTQKPVCFELKSTGPNKNFVEEGHVTSSTYPNYAGFYVVFKHAFHLTFLNSDRPFVTITGIISQGHLAYTAATEFVASGKIINVGTLTEKKGCTSS